MKKIMICLCLLLSACSSKVEKKPFVKDETNLTTEFTSYQNIDPIKMKAYLFKYNTIGLQEAVAYEINQVEKVIEALKQLTPSYTVARNDSMVTRLLLHFEDVEGNVWVMEELSDENRHYMSVNEGKFVLEVQKSFTEMIQEFLKEEETLRIISIHTPDLYNSEEKIDQELSLFVENELTSQELMQDPRLYIQNFWQKEMMWQDFRQELLLNGWIDSSIQEIPFQKGSYQGVEIEYDPITENIISKKVRAKYLTPRVKHVAQMKNKENQVIDYYMRYDTLEESLWHTSDPYSILTWLVYHPYEVDLIQIENDTSHGQMIRKATLIQQEKQSQNYEVRKQDFQINEKGNYVWHQNNKQAVLLEKWMTSISENKVNILNESDRLISLSYEENMGKHFIVDKQSGYVLNDEMILDEILNMSAHQVFQEVENQLNISACQYSDYDSNKDIPACFEVEWSMNSLDEKENIIQESSFRVNEEGNLYLDVYVKEYGFRDHIESVMFQ